MQIRRHEHSILHFAASHDVIADFEIGQGYFLATALEAGGLINLDGLRLAIGAQDRQLGPVERFDFACDDRFPEVLLELLYLFAAIHHVRSVPGRGVVRIWTACYADRVSDFEIRLLVLLLVAYELGSATDLPRRGVALHRLQREAVRVHRSDFTHHTAAK